MTDRENLKKQLEIQVGMPLTPKKVQQVEKSFDGDTLIVNYYPLHEITRLTIDKKEISSDDYILVENEGIIYFNNVHQGLLYIEYTYCIPEDEYSPILDLMEEYESDVGWNKNASSIREGDITISYDTSLGKGALINSMIIDLRGKYNCFARMI